MFRIFSNSHRGEYWINVLTSDRLGDDKHLTATSVSLCFRFFEDFVANR